MKRKKGEGDGNFDVFGDDEVEEVEDGTEVDDEDGDLYEDDLDDDEFGEEEGDFDEDFNGEAEFEGEEESLDGLVDDDE